MPHPLAWARNGVVAALGVETEHWGHISHVHRNLKSVRLEPKVRFSPCSHSVMVRGIIIIIIIIITISISISYMYLKVGLALKEAPLDTYPVFSMEPMIFKGSPFRDFRTDTSCAKQHSSFWARTSSSAACSMHPSTHLLNNHDHHHHHHHHHQSSASR